MSNKNNIVFLDIETKPAIAYVWNAFDNNIGLDQIIEATGILCVGVKTLGVNQTLIYSEWEHGQYEMLREVHQILSDCEIVVTYNGDKFDLPFLYGEMLKVGLPPLPPLTSVDLYKTIKKTKYFSKKLGFVGPYLGLGAKQKTGGFDLWVDVLAGKPQALRKMQNYCKQDVRLTEKLYLKLKAYIPDHPNLVEQGAGPVCGACGSKHLIKSGFRRTKMFKIQRLQCQSCGNWQTGTRTKV